MGIEVHDFEHSIMASFILETLSPLLDLKNQVAILGNPMRQGTVSSSRTRAASD